jgi:hypothetical protein
LSALSDRLDSKFLTAYWLPAFVAVCGGFGILAIVVGFERMAAWVNDLDSVEQSIGAVVLLLQITMWALVLRALTQPIAEFFAGSAMPKALAQWSMRGQRRAKAAAEHLLDADPVDPLNTSLARPAALRLDQLFPQDDADMQPTLFGNVLATAGEHPRLAFSMDGAFWWPRLSPLLPSSFQEMLGGTQAPLMALLNLSVVFSALGLLGVAVLGLGDRQWPMAIAFLAGGAVLSRLCYRAAVSQAVTFASVLRVAFDLYRYEILKQMDLDAPGDVAAERALWQRLTREYLDLPETIATTSTQIDAAAATAKRKNATST